MSQSFDPESDVQLLNSDEPIICSEQLALSVGFVGLDSWMKFVEKTYGHTVYRLQTRNETEITGLLALAHVEHPLFGNYLATAPFGSYGGFAYTSMNAQRALLNSARVLSQELGVEYINIRFSGGELIPPDGWIQNPLETFDHCVHKTPPQRKSDKTGNPASCKSG